MAIERRTFLAGAVSALSLAALTACTPDAPRPTPTPTGSPAPTPLSPVPRPAGYLRSSWSTDPFSLGSFSSTPVGAGPGDRATLRETVGDRVVFAGEAVASEHPGTLQGALESGTSAAERVRAIADDGERIAVIGAGLAGATAARALADAGFDVVVLEGRDRVGGRILTREESGWPFPVELGSPTVSGADIDDALLASDVDTLSLAGDSEVRTASGEVDPPSTVGPDAVSAAVAWARAQPADVSLASALSASGAEAVPTAPDADGVSPADRLAHYLDTAVATRAGASAFELSASYGVAEPPSGDGPDAPRLVVGGLDAVVEAALDDLDVVLSSTVIRIGYDDDGVSLRLGRGESLNVDRVVVTVPLGVLKTGAIEFAPALPQPTLDAIDALGVGELEQLWLRFDEPFWSTEATVLSVIDDTAVVAEWINLLPSTGQAILVGLTAADDVPVGAALGDDEFVEAALATLVPFIDPDAVATPTATPEPTAAG
ncbi:FAD-dependent oxidoreductase [Herbiconiux sp. VKM Ac-1786]|uniref:flavin monoamine oxidase family protein n=1 Tax=Herbiconiux sp. VKM Ac-1786 TaxID=2783824 RepID=UPI00188B6472|nr:FAD-dependent oxidoreductase [Herbiconiux sp. VKM Ac-1786]MBF4573369.1 FAD-dependent oxidoreductase [Herbiconiux sp. VKM Ac-1786]